MGEELLASMSMLNSSIQNVGNAYLTNRVGNKEREFAEKMYQRQVEDNRINWQMQNEYNSPSAQTERLIAAGINPATAWSKGMSADTGNSSEPDAATPLAWQGRVPAGLAHISPFEQLNMMLQAEKTRAELEKMGADTRNIDEATNMLKLEQVEQAFDNSMKTLYGEEKVKGELGVQVATISDLFARARLANSEEELNKVRKDLEEENLDILRKKKPNLIALAEREVQLKDAEITTEGKKQKAYEASASESYASASEHKAGARLKNAEAWNQEFENQVVEEVGKEDAKVARTNMLWNYVNQYEINQKTREQIEVYIDLLKIEKDQKKIRLYIDAIGTLIHGAAAVAPLARGN